MYGLLISFGILTSALLAEKLAKKDGQDTNILWSGLLVGIIAGVLVARLYHVLHFWNYYSTQPSQILAIHKGGLGIPGGIAGALIALVIYLKVNKQNILYWLDLGALFLPLGQSIGRWGNFFNNELMPYALYESVADLFLFVLLFIVYKKTSKPGLILILYLLAYFFVIRVLLLSPYKTNFWLI